MASPLYAAFPVATPVSLQSTPAPSTWPRGPLFNWETQDYARDASGAVILADGWTTWRQWCEKALLTQMRAYLIHGRNYGVDHEHLLKLRPHALVQAEYAAGMTATLKLHPATRDVNSFGFQWVGRVLYPSCTAIPVAGAPARIDILALLGPSGLPGGV